MVFWTEFAAKIPFASFEVYHKRIQIGVHGLWSNFAYNMTPSKTLSSNYFTFYFFYNNCDGYVSYGSI